MSKTYYKTNMQKLLLMAAELHSRGYENLIVIPSMAPSGMHWRCQFEGKENRKRVAPSNWIQDHFSVRENEIEWSIEEVTPLRPFQRQRHHCPSHHNLSALEIEAFYGNRLRSRMREMFNLFGYEIDADDKRS